ncbi:hypothetical protein [Dickeya chrysanthemi]|uniref:Phage protein n=1 Tax=Dickeya chrysanthemi TaxID=556 RepID=A0ABU8JU40_DICCH|nr:hypothetical protein [Dickeya chrysanthemi]MBX9446916.1 hypothetical protein [Dickeya chrysanthemi]
MIEDDIYPLLGKLVNGRVYAYAIPFFHYHSTHQKHPFILFSLSQEYNYDVAQKPTSQLISISVACYAGTVAEARALREQAKVALTILKPNKSIEYNDFDVEYEKFRMTLEILLSR